MEIHPLVKPQHQSPIDALLSGRLLDVYPDEQHSLAIWMLTTGGERLKLFADLPVTFYAGGSRADLRALWRFLQRQPFDIALSRENIKVDGRGLQTLLAIECASPAIHCRIVDLARARYPELKYYNHDLPISARFFNAFGARPHTLVHAALSKSRIVSFIQGPAEESEPAAFSLKMLRIRPLPAAGDPIRLVVQSENGRCEIPVQPVSQLLVRLGALIRKEDPDLILAPGGLFPKLWEHVQEHSLTHFNPNRDPDQPDWRTRLFGRILLDSEQTPGFADYGLEGLLEQARMTGMTLPDLAGRTEWERASAHCTMAMRKTGVLVPDSAPAGVRQAETVGRRHPPPGRHKFVGMLAFTAFHACLFLQLDRPEAAVHQDLLCPLAARQVALQAIRNTLDDRDFEAPGLDRQIAALDRFNRAHLTLAFTRRPELQQAFAKLAAGVRKTVRQMTARHGCIVLYFTQENIWLSSPDLLSRRDLHPIMESLANATGLPVSLKQVLAWLQVLPGRGSAPACFGHQTNGQPHVSGFPQGKLSEAVGEVQIVLAQLLGQLPSPDLVSERLSEILSALRTRFPRVGYDTIAAAIRPVLGPLGYATGGKEELLDHVSAVRPFPPTPWNKPIQ